MERTHAIKIELLAGTLVVLSVIDMIADDLGVVSEDGRNKDSSANKVAGRDTNRE